MCECFKALGPQVQVSQWEVDRAGRSYSYNTVSMLQEKYPGAQLYMTLAAICWKHLMNGTAGGKFWL